MILIISQGLNRIKYHIFKVLNFLIFYPYLCFKFHFINLINCIYMFYVIIFIDNQKYFISLDYQGVQYNLCFSGFHQLLDINEYHQNQQ